MDLLALSIPPHCLSPPPIASQIPALCDWDRVGRSHQPHPTLPPLSPNLQWGHFDPPTPKGTFQGHNPPPPQG